MLTANCSIQFWEGGCNGKVIYGGYNNTGIPCQNTDNVAMNWDTIKLFKQQGLQIQLFANENCATPGNSTTCAVWNNPLNADCVTSITPGGTGNFFAKSLRVVENAGSNGNCAALG